VKFSSRVGVFESLVILIAISLTVATGYFYLPAGIVLGAITLAVGGFAFDGLSEEQRVFRTSPWLLPSVGLMVVAGITLLILVMP
jgi:hypothetical protein